MANLKEHDWPDVVAIDSPPHREAAGSSRRAERILHHRHIRIFWTPSDPAAWQGDNCAWMRVGERAYDAIRERYPLYESGDDVTGRAIEIYPHASAVVLRGKIWPSGTHRRVRAKREWRVEVLRDRGVDTTALRSLDEVDAALAALTALYAAAGVFTPAGDPGDGVIVVPTDDLAEKYEREP